MYSIIYTITQAFGNHTLVFSITISTEYVQFLFISALFPISALIIFLFKI